MNKRSLCSESIGGLLGVGVTLRYEQIHQVNLAGRDGAIFASRCQKSKNKNKNWLETSTLSVGKRAATERGRRGGGEREESGTETLNTGPEAESVRERLASCWFCVFRKAEAV